jgi:hypothetical protein
MCFVMAYFILHDRSIVIKYLSSAYHEAINYGAFYSLLLFPSSEVEMFSHPSAKFISHDKQKLLYVCQTSTFH